MLLHKQSFKSHVCIQGYTTNNQLVTHTGIQSGNLLCLLQATVAVRGPQHKKHKLEHRKFWLGVEKTKPKPVRVVGQRVFKESFLGNTPKVIAPGPEQSALTVRRLDYTVSRGSFQPTRFYGCLYGVYEQKRKSWWENLHLVQLTHKRKVNLEIDSRLIGK